MVCFYNVKINFIFKIIHFSAEAIDTNPRSLMLRRLKLFHFLKEDTNTILSVKKTSMYSHNICFQ